MAKSRSMKDWQKRGFEHPELRTKDNESTRSRVNQLPNGKEGLYPTIRARGPGLERLTNERADAEAIERKDYVEYDTAEEGVAASKAHSWALGRSGDSPMGKFLAAQTPIGKRDLAASKKKKK